MLPIGEKFESFSSSVHQIFPPRTAVSLPGRIALAAAALLCTAAIFHSVTLARADWLRRHPTQDNVNEAIRLDPENSYGYTLRAEWQERAGNLLAAESSWREAVARNPRNAESSIRAALLAEQRGDIPEAERLLLAAERVSRTWYPAWALVTFYARQGREAELYGWSRQAAERASDDWVSLMPVLDQAGASTDLVLDRILPSNRAVLASYLQERLTGGGKPVSLARAAGKLARLIPLSSAGWPGTDGWAAGQQAATDRERRVLLQSVDRLMDTRAPSESAALWNALQSQRIVSAGEWTPEHPIINSEFRSVPENGGLDWRFSDVSGIQIDFRPAAGEVALRLSGRQPDPVVLMEQRLYLPPGRAWNLVIESRTIESRTLESRTKDLKAGSGLEWRLEGMGESVVLQVIPSQNWVRSATPVPPPAAPRTARLLLTSRRRAGFTRAEGEARFRLVSIEAAP